MREKYSGLATHFQKSCKKAMFVWRNTNRLNLVMNSVMTYCQDVKHTLGLLENVCFVQHIVLFVGFQCISWTRHEQVDENRLRTSLAEETMSALVIFAATRDIMLQINNDDAISRLGPSPSLPIVLSTVSSWLLIPTPDAEHNKCQ